MAIVDIFVLIAGMAIGVYFHDTLVKWWQGAAAFAASLEAKAAAIKAAFKPAAPPPAAPKS